MEGKALAGVFFVGGELHRACRTGDPAWCDENLLRTADEVTERGEHAWDGEFFCSTLEWVDDHVLAIPTSAPFIRISPEMVRISSTPCLSAHEGFDLGDLLRMVSQQASIAWSNLILVTRAALSHRDSFLLKTLHEAVNKLDFGLGGKGRGADKCRW